ncbi:MAG: response regulator [Gemmatimonadetes bacterium]|nr:response regulator [Gemmatimonadota bacterium]MBI2404317.1 response regulator [Gemmatimonadota bacterium]MBI2536493.1 response regulator [Gemmatimonadota bacterium]
MPDTGVRRRVLFVEDEIPLQSAYRRSFERHYELAFAGTGAEALERFESFGPDVVVMDLHLPDTDGIEVLRRMRDAKPVLPIVITSGYASLLPVVEVLGIPHHGYLVKPFELDALRTCIDAAR